MPFFVQRGSVPPKRHTQFRRPDGGLYAEELISTKGFEGVYSLAYHVRPPTDVGAVAPWPRPPVRYVPNDPLANRHYRTARIARGGDAIDARVPLVGNESIALATARVVDAMAYFYRNGGADELLFVQSGDGTLETPFGMLAYRAHDYLVIPCGTTYRLQPASETVLFICESAAPIEIPKHYRNAYGQLREHAPYYERDFRAPELAPPHDEDGPFELRVTARGRSAIYELGHHPFDVVGWDGFCYPYAFNADEFAPVTGKLHQPPSSHAIFETAGAAFILFAPRLFDYHELAIPAPYNHASVDCDEIIYYASGDFMSRRGIETRSVTLHAAGMQHGPQPGAVEASIGKTRTDELAVAVDAFAPLQLAEEAAAIEDRTYFRSWHVERAPLA
jgi:homogentisate 1,2-dioxygenase